MSCDRLTFMTNKLPCYIVKKQQHTLKCVNLNSWLLNLPTQTMKTSVPQIYMIIQ